MLPWFTALMTTTGILLAGLAGYVGWRRGSQAGVALAVLLAAVAWWGLAYAFELLAGDLGVKSLWGDLKYVGVALLAPSWLVFVLQYTNRGHLVTTRLLGLLTIEPVAVMVVLFVPATHDLVHFYPADAAGQELPVVGTGPVFWVHLVYSNLMILVATGLFVVSMVRLSGTYRRMALVLVAAALLPWVFNLLHNFEVGWFATMDLTPFAFIVTGGVLVWGLFRERLVRLSPLARGVIVENMSDAVFVLDAFGRVTDVNPAGIDVLRTPRSQLVGLALTDVLARAALDGTVAAAPAVAPAVGSAHEQILLLNSDEQERTFEVRREPLRDSRHRAAGQLVILRDVTERVRSEETLAQLLGERSRVAAALQQSLLPGELPRIPDTEIVGRYEPAGDGHEIGGDFYDVFPLADGAWGIVLGDVSGKGAEAATVTALARYTLRALAQAEHEPSRTLRDLNVRMLADTELERHCTIVYAVVRARGGRFEITFSLAGHHPPLICRRTGIVEAVGELGTALGLLEEVELHDTHVVLERGELICLFTDGLIEAMHDRDLFGPERVATILERLHGQPLSVVAAELVDAPRRFHGPELVDDLAVLLFRVDEPPHHQENQMSTAPSRVDFQSGEATIAAYRWDPEGEPRGIAQITHGMGEHALRYSGVAQALTEAGYVTYAQDHRGHGSSTASGQELGAIGADGWTELVEDIGRLGDVARAAHPGLPLVLIGHSMGSFAAQQYVLGHSRDIDALVLTGTAAIDLLEPALNLDEPIDLSDFNAPFAPARTDFDWLSRDETEVDKYVADPLCGFGLDTAAGKQMFLAAREVADPAQLDGIRKDLPIHISVGEADPVNGGGVLVTALADRLEGVGIDDVTLVIWPAARHEVFNETNRDEIIAEMVRWIDHEVGS